MNQFQKIYEILFRAYDSQGWWPLLSHTGTNPTKTGSITGYHPNDYSFPKNIDEQFEICLGAILTQNSAWQNVEKVLQNLNSYGKITPELILNLSEEKLKLAIKPSGYFNQKFKKIIIFTDFFLELKYQIPSREELLNLWGIGPETADSILLYAFKINSFVVDTYTKRIFYRIGIIEQNLDYDKIKNLFEKNINTFNELNVQKNLEIYQEYHALIVEHAKRYCKTKPDCENCILKEICKKIL